MVEQSSSTSRSSHRDAGLGIYDESYEKHGFTYGSDPVPVAKERPKVEYFTPAPKSMYMQNTSTETLYNLEDSERRSTDKKRKRVQSEESEAAAARRPSELDHIMADAPPAILHSGLTGGLGRLLTKSKFSPRSELLNDDRDPPSPVKRTIKPAVKEKDRGRKAESVLVKVRKRRSSDESRPRKQRRSEHESDRHSKHSHHDRPKRKAIEYHTEPHADDLQQQLVLFQTRAALFTSFVTKGPDSEQGYSLHKALKRYHRERGEEGLGLDKADEEKELFKALRLRRNDRGEIVVFF